MPDAMILIGGAPKGCKAKTVVLVTRRRRSKWWQIACFGQKRHYDKDGRCVHTDELVGRLRPEIDRRYVRVLPFGDRERKTISAVKPDSLGGLA